VHLVDWIELRDHAGPMSRGAVVHARDSMSIHAPERERRMHGASVVFVVSCAHGDTDLDTPLRLEMFAV
jgi:hypothetical protein